MKSPVARIQIAGWLESNRPWQGIKSVAGSNEIARGKDSNCWLVGITSPMARNEIGGWPVAGIELLGGSHQIARCKDSNRWLAVTKSPWQGIKSLAGSNEIARGEDSNGWLAVVKSPLARIQI